jgi:Tn3 transposase DDE domain
VQLGLNKGEAKNALARAVFFNRLGELRDRSFENQRYRASGLNLVVAAIVLWNTVYLGRAIHGLRVSGLGRFQRVQSLVPAAVFSLVLCRWTARTVNAACNAVKYN